MTEPPHDNPRDRDPDDLPFAALGADLASLRDLPTPAGLEDRLLAGIPFRQTRRPIRRVLWLSAAAAACALAAFLILPGSQPPHRQIAQEPPRAAIDKAPDLRRDLSRPGQPEGPQKPAATLGGKMEDRDSLGVELAYRGRERIPGVVDSIQTQERRNTFGHFAYNAKGVEGEAVVAANNDAGRFADDPPAQKAPPCAPNMARKGGGTHNDGPADAGPQPGGNWEASNGSLADLRGGLVGGKRNPIGDRDEDRLIPTGPAPAAAAPAGRPATIAERRSPAKGEPQTSPAAASAASPAIAGTILQSDGDFSSSTGATGTKAAPDGGGINKDWAEFAVPASRSADSKGRPRKSGVAPADIPASGPARPGLPLHGFGGAAPAGASEAAAPAPVIVALADGQRLAVTAVSPAPALRAVCGDVPLPSAGLQRFEPASDQPGRYRATFIDGSTLTGPLVSDTLTLTLALGPKVVIRNDQFHDLLSPAKPAAPPAEAATLLLRNGDRLFGTVQADRLTVVLADLGPIAVPPARVKGLAFAPPAAGQPVSVDLWDGSRLNGLLVEKTIAFGISHGGPVLQVPAGLVASITRPQPAPDSRPSQAPAARP